MRARFDAYKEEKDPRKAQLLYLDGCRQIWERRHWTTFRCKHLIYLPYCVIPQSGETTAAREEEPSICEFTLSNIYESCHRSISKAPDLPFV